MIIVIFYDNQGVGNPDDPIERNFGIINNFFMSLECPSGKDLDDGNNVSHDEDDDDDDHDDSDDDWLPNQMPYSHYGETKPRIDHGGIFRINNFVMSHAPQIDC